MGKKKGTPGSMSKCRSCLEFGDFDDNASAVSSQGTGCLSACGGDGPSTDDLALDQFSQHLDDLFEKRGSTREKALEMLIAMLREDVRAEDCEKNESTLIGRCTNSLKRGGAAEAANAATLLALHILTLPQPSDRLLLEFQDDVVKAAQSGKSIGGRVAALEALALTTFVASEDDAHTLEVMAHARALWRAGDAKVRAAALRVWSLLYVSLQNSLPQAAVDRTLQELTALLNETDVDVRGATGEAVALLYHLAGLADSDALLDGGAEAEDSDSDAPLQRSPATSASAGSTSAGLDDVVDRMRDLASNKGDAMRRSRRDKASLRSTFRGLLALLNDSTSSSTKVKLQHGDVLYVDSMEKVVALNYFRRVLGSGFQVHLQHNPLLHDVFDYKPAVKRGERLSALEKRYTRSPSSAASKDRTASRKSDRASKSASRTHLPDLAEY